MDDLDVVLVPLIVAVAIVDPRRSLPPFGGSAVATARQRHTTWEAEERMGDSWIDRLQARLESAGKSIEDAGRRIDEPARNAGSSITSFGWTLTLYVTVSLLLIITLGPVGIALALAWAVILFAARRSRRK